MFPSSQKVTQDQAKQHNKNLILKAIYDAGEISRADIARVTGLTRTTVSNVVNELRQADLVAELGLAPSAGGKPPTLLHVPHNARQVIGVDLAGGEFHGCVYDLRGRQLHRAGVPLRSASGIHARQRVYDLLDQLIAQVDRPLLGIGIGSPGLMDAQEGVVHQAVNLGWRDVPLRALLEERYALPVYLANDSQAAALAQYTFANEDKETSLIVVLIGRGISAGIVINGQLYHGAHNSGASEIGHVGVVEGGELCVCGHFGCLETVAGERTLLRWARKIAQNNPNSLLAQYAETPQQIDMDAVVHAYESGDTTLVPGVQQAGRYLGVAVANLVGILNIRRVVLAGGVTRFGAVLLDPLTQTLRQRVLATLAERTDVTMSRLGDEIVALGAAALLLSNELGVV